MWKVADCNSLHTQHVHAEQAGWSHPANATHLWGALGAISLGMEGMQQSLFGDASHFPRQVSVRALELVPPMGQGTAVPLAMPGADMPRGGSGQEEGG